LFSSALSFGSANPTTRVRRSTALVVNSWGSVFYAFFTDRGAKLDVPHLKPETTHPKKKKQKKLVTSKVPKKKSTSLRNNFILKIVKLRNQANRQHSIIIPKKKHTMENTLDIDTYKPLKFNCGMSMSSKTGNVGLRLIDGCAEKFDAINEEGVDA
jgi:hypothetical protein